MNEKLVEGIQNVLNSKTTIRNSWIEEGLTLITNYSHSYRQQDEYFTKEKDFATPSGDSKRNNQMNCTCGVV